MSSPARQQIVDGITYNTNLAITDHAEELEIILLRSSVALTSSFSLSTECSIQRHYLPKSMPFYTVVIMAISTSNSTLHHKYQKLKSLLVYQERQVAQLHIKRFCHETFKRDTTTGTYPILLELQIVGVVL